MVDWSIMSTFWTIFVFLYIYMLINSVWRGMWKAAFGKKEENIFKDLPLGMTLLLALLALVVWALINYGLTHLLVWWIGV